MRLRLLAHRLFQRHRWERYELADKSVTLGSGVKVTWYVGFRCTKCGEPGFGAPR